MQNFYDFLVDAGELLPATLVGAILLFVARELLEMRRRHIASGRKRKAVRRLLADEIERNHFQLKRMRNCINLLERSLHEPRAKLEVFSNTNGDYTMRLAEEQGLLSQIPIGEVHKAVLSANLLEIAMVDGEVFDGALKANDALNELEHVRISLIEQSIDTDSPWIIGFPDYALNEVSNAEGTLKKLYKQLYCFD